MNSFHKRRGTIAFALCLLGVTVCAAQERILVTLRDIEPKENRVQAFKLNRAGDIQIEAVGYRTGRTYGITLSRAWILNAENRDLVWRLEDADTHRRSRKLVQYTDTITLPPGTYEVYYSSYPFYRYHEKDGIGNFIARFFHKMFDEEDYDYSYEHYRQDWQEFNLTVRGNGEMLDDNTLRELHQRLQREAIVALTGLEDNEHRQQAFELRRSMRLFIYAIGEARKDGTFDYGWITNIDTRDKVWKFSLDNSEHAGGARKNRLIRETVSLPAGKYVVDVVTDDSHANGSWNAAPPYDPAFWGISVFVADDGMRRYVKPLDYDDFREQNMILSLTKVENNECRSQGFSCKRDMTVRIYAIGEGRPQQMFDYAWIVNADTHERIWEMAYASTEHAGGGDKNRLFDDEIRLKRGDYVIYFVSDDSHSFWNWNVTPPADPEHWGITLYGADPDFEPSQVKLFEQEDARDVIVQCTRVRNAEQQQQQFILRHDSKLRIYAIGEGSRGQMYDYGWIEDAKTGEIIWKMNYEETEHAGGARKNRVFDGTIFLKRGKYVLRFQTDDSHAYEAWNDSPPYDPKRWGITLYKVHPELH